ncbi:MAG: translocation/assembly module TamB, partial [Belliella pelovolcani]
MLSVLVLTLLTILMLLFVRSPWGQRIIVDKATTYLADRTNTTLSIGRLFVTFQGNLYLEDFYVEDLQGDTLVFSDNLELGFGLMEFVKAGTIHINKFEWEGLKAKISRAEGQKDFNYQFLIDAFAGDGAEADQDKEEVERAESNSDPIQIKLSPIRFCDFDLSYIDSEEGMEAILRFKEFKVDVPHLDLEAFKFDVRELKLQQSQISFKQLKLIESEEEASDNGLIPLLLSVEKLTLDQVILDYENQVDQQFANLSIDFFELSLPELDLQDQKVLLKSIDLKNSKIAFADFGSKKPSEEVNHGSENPFEWPDWDIEIGYIDLEDNQITYKTREVDATPGFFNPETMRFERLNFNVSNVLLKHKEAKLALRTFNFRESSGFELKGLEVNLDVDDQSLIINDIVVETNNTKLQTDLQLSYQSLAGFITQPESAKLDLRLKSLKADVRDAYFFQPDLAKDEVIQNLALFPILANGSIKGSLTSLAIPNLQAYWGSSSFVARGSVKNVLDVDQLIFDFPKLELSSDTKTITKFIEEDLIAAYQLPEKFNVSADAKGKLSDLQASVNLVSDLGEI